MRGAREIGSAEPDRGGRQRTGQSNTEGSGLGLAIAARTLEVAGGELVLELPSGGGLRVVARFPRAPDEGDGGDPELQESGVTATGPQ